MKRFDYRTLMGAALILGGILMLLDKTGLLKGATDLFWAGLLAIGAGIFLFWFFSDRSKWWAAIPGFTLVGMDRLPIGYILQLLLMLSGIQVQFFIQELMLLLQVLQPVLLLQL